MWEKFTLTGRGATPRISINKSGQIVFNRGAVNRLSLAEYKAVIFYYDKPGQKIGLRLSKNQNEEGANNLYIKSKGSYGVVSGSAFLSYYGIKKDVEGHKYVFENDPKENMLVIDLKSQQ